jgi:hypothetical protein
MARVEDMVRIRDELIDAYKWGEETRARALIFQLGDKPDAIRAELEAMLEDSYGLARQAAAFGLGELGGVASARRLDQQLLLEEAREDYDGEAVVEAIVEALGRINEAGARESLVRRLERLMDKSPARSDINVLARALWRRRHPDLIPTVRRSLERGSLPKPNGLNGLLLLLEKSPEELGEWVRDPAVPVETKTEILAVLGEDLPHAWVSPLLAFITAAQNLRTQATSERGEAAYFCERLFGLLLAYWERIRAVLPQAVRAELRQLARSLVAATSTGCAMRAAGMLKLVGRPEDVKELEAHRPADPTFAKVFDEAVQALRNLH